MAKPADQPILFMFMGLVLGMAVDFITHSRGLLGHGVPQFSDPKWDLADTSQIAAALGCAIMGGVAGSPDLANIGIGALAIQGYMKLLSYKYPWLPRYIIASGGII